MPCENRARAWNRPPGCCPRSGPWFRFPPTTKWWSGGTPLSRCWPASSLALGLAPRLSALALAGSLVPTTLAGHAYWTIDDPAVRKVQRIHFHKNMALIGGLLFAALDQP